MEGSFDKITFVSASLGLKFSFSSLLSFKEVSLVLYLVEFPGFNAFSMLLIVEPLTIVQTALSVAEYSCAVSHSVLPLALVDISVCMRHSAHTVKLLIKSLTLVLGSILVSNRSETHPLRFTILWLYPLALVLSALAYIFKVIIPRNRQLVLIAIRLLLF